MEELTSSLEPKCPAFKTLFYVVFTLLTGELLGYLESSIDKIIEKYEDSELYTYIKRTVLV